MSDNTSKLIDTIKNSFSLSEPISFNILLVKRKEKYLLTRAFEIFLEYLKKYQNTDFDSKIQELRYISTNDNIRTTFNLSNCIISFFHLNSLDHIIVTLNKEIKDFESNKNYYGAANSEFGPKKKKYFNKLIKVTREEIDKISKEIDDETNIIRETTKEIKLLIEKLKQELVKETNEAMERETNTILDIISKISTDPNSNLTYLCRCICFLRGNKICPKNILENNVYSAEKLIEMGKDKIYSEAHRLHNCYLLRRDNILPDKWCTNKINWLTDTTIDSYAIVGERINSEEFF